MIFKIDDKTLLVKKGNKKPIPKFVWIASMESGTDCSSRNNGHCDIGENCYVLKYEQNKLFYKVVERRRKDEECIDYLVANHLSRELSSWLVARSKASKSYPLRYMRWNESGDCKTLEHFLFVEEVALDLYDELGAISVIYTHRKDLWEQFKKIRKSKHCLIVNGSGFMADNNFKAVKEFSGENDECSSNCVQCFEDYLKWCYDIDATGRTIEEILRVNKKKGDKG